MRSSRRSARVAWARCIARATCAWGATSRSRCCRSTSPRNAELRARFKREAKTISSLNHPHICTLLDVGREGDTDYLVMELIEGETLAARLLHGALPPAEVLRIGAQIADALDRAHRAGVVHRDLKPGNVMLAKSGAKLMDFGLARGAARAGAAHSEATLQARTVSEPLTAEGTILGTFQYMAPEQLEGKDADSRSDLWALGCVVYESATGRRAFEGASQASLISAILRDSPRPLREITPLTPPALERAVTRCLAKDPDDRWQSAGDLRYELQWIAEAGSRAEAATPVGVRRSGRRVLALFASALCAVTALGSWFAATWWSDHARTHAAFEILTQRRAAIFRAAFAPDGKTIVYSAATEGNVPRLFVIRPEAPAPEPTGEPGIHLLSVSSKGELAVLTGAQFIRHRLFVGTLARMPLTGGAPRAILENVREADWSPDGSDLAIIREVDGKDRLEFPAGHMLCESGGYLSDLRFSPKGDCIAFYEHPFRWDDRGSVNVVDLKGRKTRLSDGYSGEEGLAWSHDSREVVFSASTAGIVQSVYVVTLAGQTRLALESAGGLTLHDIARDGRWLASRDDYFMSLMVHKPEWPDDRDLAWLDQSQEGSLSQDGRSLVFREESRSMGPSYATCLRGTDGSPVVRLGDGWPTALSPDGNWVLSVLLSEPPQLRALSTGAGQARSFERGNLENYAGTEWFPDGDSVLINANEPGKATRFYVERFGGGPPRPVTPEGTSGGRLSPDGRLILAKSGDGSYALFSIDGGAPRTVPGLIAEDRVFHRSADGRSVLVQRGNQVPVRAERVDLESGSRKPWKEVAPSDRVGLVLCWVSFVTDDERSYTYTGTRMLSTLFLVRHEK
jgi:Tol biopolymer transport system component